MSNNTRQWTGEDSEAPAEQSHDFKDRIFTRLKYKGRCVGEEHEPTSLGAASRWLEPGEFAEVDLDPQEGEPGYKLNTKNVPYKTVRCIRCVAAEIGEPEILRSDRPWEIWNVARDEALGTELADQFGATEQEKPF